MTCPRHRPANPVRYRAEDIAVIHAVTDAVYLRAHIERFLARLEDLADTNETAAMIAAWPEFAALKQAVERT